MAIINSIFIELFIVLYMVIKPLFSNPILTTYIMILALILGLNFLNYRFLKKSQSHHFKFIAFLLTQSFLIAYLLWYIFIHFHSFKTMK